MTDNFKQVLQFNEAARGDLPRKPTTLTLDQAKLCLRILTEEAFECFEAMLNPGSSALQRLRDHKDAIQYTLKYEVSADDMWQDNVGLLDGLCDTVVVAMGMAAIAGLPFNEGMAEVNASNLAKIDSATGKCVKDEGGKIQKPEGWKKPDLESIIKWGTVYGNRGDITYETPKVLTDKMEALLRACGQFPGNLSDLPKPAPLVDQEFPFIPPSMPVKGTKQ